MIKTLPTETIAAITKLHGNKGPLAVAYLEVLNTVSAAQVPMHAAHVLARTFDPDSGIWTNPHCEITATEAQHALSKLSDDPQTAPPVREFARALRSHIETGIRETRRLSDGVAHRA